MDNRVLVVHILRLFMLGMMLDVVVLLRFLKRKKQRCAYLGNSYSVNEKIPDQIKHLNEVINVNDTTCINQLRLSRNAFGRLCILLRMLGGLSPSRGLDIQTQVAMFLYILGHHKKNRIVFFDFKRSARTVSIYFHKVLQAVLKLHESFIARPEPVPQDCTDDTWKWFKGCLGALDGTYIDCMISENDKGRYRSRKGKCSVNVLAVCDRRMNFVYVLTGWEGSAADGRVLRDAVERVNGFKVPRGNYYLCDAGYTNGEGFLAPYRGVRYHLKEWGMANVRPQTAKELFNLRHSKARNCIERAFAILKGRWGILRSQSWYKIETQNKIIMACFLLHNFIRMEMLIDPIEDDLSDDDEDDPDNNVDYIPHITTSQRWTNWRDTLSNTMFNEWRSR